MADLESGGVVGTSHPASPVAGGSASSMDSNSFSAASSDAPQKTGKFRARSLADTRDPDDRGPPLIVEQSGHRLRYCNRCMFYQPLRTKHCRDCGRCVRTHDHHCPWIGTCVGEGNRAYFYWFLVFQGAELAAFLCEGGLSIVPTRRGGDPSAAPSLIVLWLGLAMIAALFLMVTCLLCFHTYLALSNLTTWESMSWHNITYLKTISQLGASPFARSVAENLAVYFLPPSLWPGKIPHKLTDDGWINWDLGEPHDPTEVDCTACGCGKFSLCACFNSGDD